MKYYIHWYSLIYFICIGIILRLLLRWLSVTKSLLSIDTFPISPRNPIIFLSRVSVWFLFLFTSILRRRGIPPCFSGIICISQFSYQSKKNFLITYYYDEDDYYYYNVSKDKSEQVRFAWLVMILILQACYLGTVGMHVWWGGSIKIEKA